MYTCTPDCFCKRIEVSKYCNWIQIRIQIVLLGFGVLRLAQQKEREGERAYLEDALVAGKGLGQDRTNDAAARSSPPGKGGDRRESEGRERFKKQREEIDALRDYVRATQQIIFSFLFSTF